MQVAAARPTQPKKSYGWVAVIACMRYTLHWRTHSNTCIYIYIYVGVIFMCIYDTGATVYMYTIGFLTECIHTYIFFTYTCVLRVCVCVCMRVRAHERVCVCACVCVSIPIHHSLSALRFAWALSASCMCVVCVCVCVYKRGCGRVLTPTRYSHFPTAFSNSFFKNVHAFPKERQIHLNTYIYTDKYT